MANRKLKLAIEADYPIEKGVPQPGRRTNNRYPLREMDVGDSFFISASEQPRVVNATSYFGSRNNRKYSCRLHGDGYRVWRVE
ncbi:MAG: hypothetical protein GY807_24010 [Gammaproteobacteria bacterium]|nr:hypothetical protein [Gammaproteobacteria bacterium]